MSEIRKMRQADTIRETLRSRFPEEFDDGARCGFTRKYPGERARGGYPKDFRTWPIERRHAWFAGFNKGFWDRETFDREGAA